jgi:hypothetical protein
MVIPSSLMYEGIKLDQIDNFYLFKFTDSLQTRSDELLERSKNGTLTPDEVAEHAAISELSRIFTYANSLLAAQSKWFPTSSENSSEKELDNFANIATPQSI